MEKIEIFDVQEACSNYVEPIRRLLSQLSSSEVRFTQEHLLAIVESEASHLFLARHKGEIVAMLTLGEYIAPTGR